MRASTGLDPTHNVVNRLALVLQVLLDIRSVELKRENQQLKDHWRVREELIPDDDGDGVFWLLVKEETSTASWFDRLALVSKAFMDTRFLELRRKNERLKLDLFWKAYNVDMLQKELCKTQISLSLFYCNCVSCVTNGRISELDKNDEASAGLIRCTSCAYKEWFEDVLEDTDMDVCYDGDDDGHFCFHGSDNWSWVYGSKLVQARSVSSRHLRKLAHVFAMLYSMRNPS